MRDLTTPTGRAMAGMVAVFAEFEREIFDKGHGDSAPGQHTIAMQKRQLREYAKRRDWTIVREVEEVGSGAKRRPKRDELVDAARRREIGASVHETNCAHFVLSVWNLGDTEDAIGPFNAMRALAGWDRAHRAAYVE